MRRDAARLLSDYESAVLTVFDGSGNPTSVRCRPVPAGDALSIELPPWLDAVEGRAGLMCHDHDHELWHQRSFNVRGRLTGEAGRWLFHPERLVLGMGYGPLSLLRMMARGRRRAARYLEARGLARPRVPWDQMAAIKREAFRGGR